MLKKIKTKIKEFIEKIKAKYAELKEKTQKFVEDGGLQDLAIVAYNVGSLVVTAMFIGYKHGMKTGYSYGHDDAIYKVHGACYDMKHGDGPQDLVMLPYHMKREGKVGAIRMRHMDDGVLIQTGTVTGITPKNDFYMHPSKLREFVETRTIKAPHAYNRVVEYCWPEEDDA